MPGRIVIPLLVLLLSGCVSQRYTGISITSTAPMHVTKVTVRGGEIVMCSVGP